MKAAWPLFLLAIVFAIFSMFAGMMASQDANEPTPTPSQSVVSTR